MTSTVIRMMTMITECLQGQVGRSRGVPPLTNWQNACSSSDVTSYSVAVSLRMLCLLVLMLISKPVRTVITVDS